MTRRTLGRWSALGAAVAFTLNFSPAHAADEITIDHVATAGGTVSVLLSVDGLPAGATPQPESVAVTVDGESVRANATTVEAGEIERTTILVIDASNSMRGGRLASAQAAAKAFLAAAPADVEVGLVTFAGTVQEAVSPTTDHDTVAAAVDAIELSRQTGVYDAMIQAINLAGSEGARSLLVLSDGADTNSIASHVDVATAAEQAGVIVDVVSLDRSPPGEATLKKIAAASGGKVIGTDAAALSEVFTAQADALASQLLVEFPPPDTSNEEASLEVSLKASGVTYADAAFVMLERTFDSPRVVDVGDPLVGPRAMLLGAMALGVGLAGILALALAGGRSPSAPERRLGAYFGRVQGSAGGTTGGAQHLASPAKIKNTALGMSEKIVKGDFEAKISQRLSGAGSKLTAAEWLLIHAGTSVAFGFVGLIFAGGFGLIGLLFVGAVFPWLYLKLRHSRRLAAFNAQLAETLGLMAGGLQAGLSLPQAVDTVVREGHEPMAGELKRVLIEQRLGIDIEEALEGVGSRMESEDFAWVVMAIRIQREVGGNLAEILNTVADTLREREYLRRQVKSLAAEGRLSGYILGGLPPLIFIYMLMSNPTYVEPLYTTFAGYVLLGAACGLLGLGGWMMSKIAKVEV